MPAAAAAAVAVESATETAVVAVMVLVDLRCCRMERGSTGLDSFYVRKKKLALKRGGGSRAEEKRGPCGTRPTSTTQRQNSGERDLLTTSAYQQLTRELPIEN